MTKKNAPTKRLLHLAAVFAAVLPLLGLAPGCDTLPAGTPPEGDIVDNAPETAESRLALHNRLVTEFVAFALTSGISELRAEDDGISSAVAFDASRIVGFLVRPDAQFKLGAETNADGDTKLILRDAVGKLLWQSSYFFPREKAERRLR